jgi:malate/lactate dehydrogenase
MSVQEMTTTSAPPPSPAVLDTMVRVIMGQTEMTHDEIVCALERTNYDLKRVIREYIHGGSGERVTNDSSSANVSANQLRFSEIRNFMDKSDALYYRRREMTKIYNEVLERKKAAAEAAGAAATAEAAATAGSSMGATAKL